MTSNSQRVSCCPDPEAAFELLTLMKNISEKHFAAGWRVHFEFLLWNAIFDTLLEFGFTDLSFNDRSKVLELTHRCQGWWVWTIYMSSCTFVMYDEWLPMYQKYNVKYLV